MKVNLFFRQAKNPEEQRIRMAEAPIGPLILSLAIPSILSMLVMTLYNTADTYFVSQLGTSASGAVGIVFSLMSVIQAIGFTLGMGSGSMISRLLGAGENKKAGVYATTAIIGAFLLGLVICISGLFTLDKLMLLLGSTPTILPYAKSYSEYILFGAPIMCSSFTMNGVLRSEGHSAFAMCGIMSGSILNIALDPIFIFRFGLGIAGAAMATLLCQCISFSVLLSFFLRKKSIVRLHFKYLSRNARTYFDILRLGFPSLSRQGLAGISTAALNVAASSYGDPAVAAMSIVGRIFVFIFSVMIGLGQGFIPVVGFNYGSGRYKRVADAFWFTVKIGMGLMSLLTLVGLIFATDIIALFRREDALVIEIGAKAMRFQCCVLLLQPFCIATNMMHQATGYALRSTFLSCMRQGIYFLPLILILKPAFGLTGVEITQTISDILSFLTTLPFLYIFINMLREKGGYKKQRRRRLWH